MSSAAPHPRMHGITHVAGGPDPVPGLLPGGTATYTERILATDNLWTYWPIAYGYDVATSGQAVDYGPLGANLDPVSLDIGQYGASGPIPASDELPYSVEFLGPSHGPSSGGIVEDSFVDTPGAAGAETEFTAMAWVMPYRTLTSPEVMAIVGNWAAFHTGWSLGLLYDLQLVFSCGDGSSFNNVIGATLPANEWTHVTASRSVSDGIKLYANAALVAEDASAHTLNNGSLHLRIGAINTDSFVYYFNGRIAGVALFTAALPTDEIIRVYGEGTSPAGGHPGDQLELDPGGNPTWTHPSPQVTVNHKPAPPSRPPTPAKPTTPPSGVTDWIFDQPYVHGGTSFTVPPKTWVTVPFTTPALSRQSNATGVTATVDLAWNDPDAGGWINPDSPHTILIPHDMPFLTDAAAWMQVCLRLESPAVEAATSQRRLRVFETTHQKTLVDGWARRDQACVEGGAINVYGAGTPSSVFADGDTGSTGSHDTIMFVPNAGYAYYLNGNDWLPKDPSSGDPTLKRGMRLVAQVWHDASASLTFHCDPATGSAYKPHLVFMQVADTGWGPPWSTWY